MVRAKANSRGSNAVSPLCESLATESLCRAPIQRNYRAGPADLQIGYDKVLGGGSDTAAFLD